MMESLLCFSQNSSIYFNKAYSCDTLQQNAIAVLPHHDQYLVVGIYQNSDAYSAFYVRALDKFGKILWEKNIDQGYQKRNLSGGGSFISTSDGHFVIAAAKSLAVSSFNETERQSIVVIKINEQGDIVWKKNLQQQYIHSTRQIVETRDGGFVVIGYQKLEDGKTHAYITKLDKRGEMEWDKQLRLGNKSVALSVEITAENDYLLSGYQMNDQTATDMFVCKVSSKGEQLWTKTYGTQEHDTGSTLKALPNGDFLMAGAVREQGIKKLYIAQLDFNGNLLWHKIHALPNIANIQTSLQLTDNGGFGGVGYFTNESGKTTPIVLFFDKNGDLTHQQIIEGQSQNNTYIKDIEPTIDGGYVLAGFNYSQQSSWILKTDGTGYACEELNCQREGDSTDLLTNLSDPSHASIQSFLQIVPNPIVLQATISYQLPPNEQFAEVLIYNQSGQMVQKLAIHQNKGVKTIAAKDFGSGTYVYQVLVKNKTVETGRFNIH